MSTSQHPFWLRYTPVFIRKRLAGRSTLHAIIHNTGWLLGEKALRLGLGLLVGAWVARYLGPSQYGEFAYVLAFVAFFQTISLLGLDGVAIRDMARDRDASPAILGTVFRLRLITGMLCWLVAIGAMAVFRPGDTNTLLLTAVVSGSPVFQAADTIDLWFQSQTQSKRTVLAKAFAYVLNSMLKVYLILAKAPLLYFAIAGLVEFVLAAGALWYSYRVYPAPFTWRWDLDRAKQLMKESWPYLLSGIAIMVYIRIDQIMLREMLGTNELGIFSAALSLSTTWYFIPMMISQSAGPSITRKKQENPFAYNRAIDRLFSLMWWIMLPLSVCISFLAGPLINLLYGDAYSASASVLAIHVFANIPVALGVTQSIWILNERRNTLSLTRTVIGAITNVGLNFIVIPKYGALGAAYVTVISTMMSDMISNMYFAPELFKRQVMSLFPGFLFFPSRDIKGFMVVKLVKVVAKVIGVRSLIDRAIQLLDYHKWMALRTNSQIYLELGSGRKRGTNGWTTVDLSGADIAHDLRRGIPLPDGCVDRIYTSHVFEHIPYKELMVVIAECFRVLKKGGELSVCVPNAGLYIRSYLDGVKFQPDGGGYAPALMNTSSLMDQVNYIAYMNGLHHYMFDPENLVNTLKSSPFSEVRLRDFDGSVDLKSRDFESVYASAYK